MTNDQRKYLSWLFADCSPRRIRSIAYIMKHVVAEKLSVRPEEAMSLMECYAKEVDETWR